MKVVTPNDAFALALIAQKPELNQDLVARLSDSAKPVGAALLAEQTSSDPEVAEIVRGLREWAAKGKNQKNERD